MGVKEKRKEQGKTQIGRERRVEIDKEKGVGEGIGGVLSEADTRDSFHCASAGSLEMGVT